MLRNSITITSGWVDASNSNIIHVSVQCPIQRVKNNFSNKSGSGQSICRVVYTQDSYLTTYLVALPVVLASISIKACVLVQHVRGMFHTKIKDFEGFFNKTQTF